MAHVKFDLVQETSTFGGAGNVTLGGAVTRRRAFGAVLANGDTCYVLIEAASAAEWEICLATYVSAGNQLSRGAVLASSTGSQINFSGSGSTTKTISLIAPAAKSVVEDNNGDVSVTRDAAIGRSLSATEKVLGTSGVGYKAGAGGTVTQATSKATGVTLSKASGQITMHNAALAAATIVSFVLTNTLIEAGDVLLLNHVSGGTPGSYTLNARCGAGSATIDVRNATAGSLGEAIVLGFVLIKGVTA
jgi:hypothetical protein